MEHEVLEVKGIKMGMLRPAEVLFDDPDGFVKNQWNYFISYQCGELTFMTPGGQYESSCSDPHRKFLVKPLDKSLFRNYFSYSAAVYGVLQKDGYDVNIYANENNILEKGGGIEIFKDGDQLGYIEFNTEGWIQWEVSFSGINTKWESWMPVFELSKSSGEKFGKIISSILVR